MFSFRLNVLALSTPPEVYASFKTHAKATFPPMNHFWIPQLEQTSLFWPWWCFVCYLSWLFILSDSTFMKVTWHYYLKPSILCLTHYSLPGIDCPDDVWINCFAFMSPRRGPGASQDGFEWKVKLGFPNLWRLCTVSSEPGPHWAEVMDGHCVAQWPWTCAVVSVWVVTSNIHLSSMSPWSPSHPSEGEWGSWGSS